MYLYVYLHVLVYPRPKMSKGLLQTVPLSPIISHSLKVFPPKECVYVVLSSISWRPFFPFRWDKNQNVDLYVHLSSFIRATCPAHLHFCLLTNFTTSVFSFRNIFMIFNFFLSFFLKFNIDLSIEFWVISNFLIIFDVNDHVWQPYVRVGTTHTLKIWLFCVFLKGPLKIFFNDQNFAHAFDILILTFFSIRLSKDRFCPK